jgi:hypothetical protein
MAEGCEERDSKAYPLTLAKSRILAGISRTCSFQENGGKARRVACAFVRQRVVLAAA